MKKIVYILTSVCILGATASCDKDFLDKQPLDQFSEEVVWNDPALVETFVNNIYFGVPHDFSNIMLSSFTDESMVVWDVESSNVTKSLITPSYLGPWDDNFYSALSKRTMAWGNAYKNIRAANLFLENIEEAPFEDEALKNRLTGEVYFLRAYIYHNLVSLYGGVPIITEAYDLNEDYMVERNTLEESIDFIVSDLDRAAALLPLEHDGENKGRATKGAALALKSRTLLYAASDFFNSEASWAGGYAHPELVSYIGGDRMARWRAAKDAAKAVMDLGIYSLHTGGDSAALTYSEIFTTKETSEDIFVQYFIQRTDRGWDNYNPGLYNGPNGYHNWGGNTPIEQLVSDYQMEDGSDFSWDNPEHAADPYKNRDPRFYASILYEGAKWRPRPSDVIDLDPEGRIQTGFIEKPNGEVVAGLDTRKSPIEDWNGTYTGYYMRKFLDPTVDAQYFRQELPWRYIRYTEVLMNYIEASIALGEEGEALHYLNMIRERAGMPEITASGQELVEAYRQERRIELAFEGHRYFDVRRWMIAPTTLEDALGVVITYEPSSIPAGAVTYAQILEATSVEPTYTIIPVQEREWKDAVYLLPIKLDEINRNNKLVQNPLY